jgi:hypothetical protein
MRVRSSSRGDGHDNGVVPRSTRITVCLHVRPIQLKAGRGAAAPARRDRTHLPRIQPLADLGLP